MINNEDAQSSKKNAGFIEGLDPSDIISKFRESKKSSIFLEKLDQATLCISNGRVGDKQGYYDVVFDSNNQFKQLIYDFQTVFSETVVIVGDLAQFEQKIKNLQPLLSGQGDIDRLIQQVRILQDQKPPIKVPDILETIEICVNNYVARQQYQPPVRGMANSRGLKGITFGRKK